MEKPPLKIPTEDHIDLHTFSPKEISRLVADYLEEALLSGFREVRIIHGRGTGSQRRQVRGILSSHPSVESFRDAPADAGGWGATVVVLKSRR